MTKNEFIKVYRKHYSEPRFDRDERSTVAGGCAFAWILGSGLLLGSKFKTIGWIISTIAGLGFAAVVSEDSREAVVNRLYEDFEDDTSFNPEEDE